MLYQAPVILGFLLSFLFYVAIDQGEGNKPLLGDVLHLTFGKRKYHVHHWLIYTALFLLLLLLIYRRDYTPELAGALGFSLGGMTQGLMYQDAFRLAVD